MGGRSRRWAVQMAAREPSLTSCMPDIRRQLSTCLPSEHRHGLSVIQSLSLGNGGNLMRRTSFRNRGEERMESNSGAVRRKSTAKLCSR